MRRTVLTLLGAAFLLGNAYADDAAFSSTAGIGPLNGQQIYEQICQGCHMPGGLGASGAGFYPKLAGNKSLVSWEYIALRVLNGRNGMPAFGLPKDMVQQMRSIQLTDAQVAEVVNYVRSHFDNHYKSEVTAKQVSALPHPSETLSPF